MPVKKVDDHWEVDGEEYKTEAAANNAYKAKAALAMGIEPEKETSKDDKKNKKSKKTSKKKSKKDDVEEEDQDEDEE